MVYRGCVKNGKIELEGEVRLPDGTPVEVTVGETSVTTQDDHEGPTLYERLKPFISSAKNLPSDASINVDHYLYGLPKR